MKKEKKRKSNSARFSIVLSNRKEGQNARLAAKLTGWKIDIKRIPT